MCGVGSHSKPNNSRLRWKLSADTVGKLPAAPTPDYGSQTIVAEKVSLIQSVCNLFIMKIVHRVQVKRKQIQTEKRHKNTDTHIKKRMKK